MTTIEIKSKLKKINPRILVIGEYAGAFDPLKCKCTKCNHVWFPKWRDLSQGSGCPKCARKRLSSSHRFTLKQIKEKVKKVSPSIKVIGRYKNAVSPICCKCLVCKHKWSPVWDTLRVGRGCPKCGIRKCSDANRFTLEQVKEKIKKINPSIKIVGKYISALSPINCKCLICSGVWNSTWAHLSQKHGCPKCNLTGGIIEERVRKIFERITGWKFQKVNPSKIPWLQGLYLDGYNYKHKIAFEYQGPQHYKLCRWNKFNKRILHRQKQNDKKKKLLCKRNKIKLICVPFNVKEEEFIKKNLRRLGFI